MSYLSFHSPAEINALRSVPAAPRNVGAAFSNWLLTHYGKDYRRKVQSQRSRPQAKLLKSSLPGGPLVGIVGGGFAGMYAGLILQSLGIEFELFESSDRVGGRIKTWYSTDYDQHDVNKAGLYGEVGGMRLPQFSPDMLPVQQLALSVNAVLERNGMKDKMVYWRKFYYNSPVQRLRYNNMPAPITAAESGLNSLNFGTDEGGDVPMVWVTEKKDANGNAYLPINMVMEMVNDPFIKVINKSFEAGFALLMKYDQYSMWSYLTNVFTLGDLNEYYDPAMGEKTDNIPWSVASFLETTSVGTGMFSVSFVEMVLAAYDWGGSKDPYRPNDPNIYMLTVDRGMQHFPDACHTVLNLDKGVREEDGYVAQVQVGMLPGPDGKYSYAPPNLTKDAQPLPPETMTSANNAAAEDKSKHKQRVFMQHKVVQMKYDPTLHDGHGGMKVKIEHEYAAGAAPEVIEKEYPYVISTLPFGVYLNGDMRYNLLNDLSFPKAQAIRQCNYMPSFKAFLTFKTQFWAKLGKRQDMGLGAAATDRPNRQIIYPSYGYEAEQGVLQVYSWAEDARRMGALSDEERINECLKGIAYLYPDGDVFENFAGYHDGKTTKTWFWDKHAGGGAFALYAPDQFKNIYPTLLTPEFDGCLNFAGECCSVHHGWIVGALDSAYNAVYNILKQIGDEDKIAQMQATWGTLTAPDVDSLTMAAEKSMSVA